MVALTDAGSFALLSRQLERRLEVVHVEPHGFVDTSQNRGCLEPFASPVTDGASDHRSILLLDPGLSRSCDRVGNG